MRYDNRLANRSTLSFILSKSRGLHIINDPRHVNVELFHVNIKPGKLCHLAPNPISPTKVVTLKNKRTNLWPPDTNHRRPRVETWDHVSPVGVPVLRIYVRLVTVILFAVYFVNYVYRVGVP